ncbi:MAG: hypothetical protein WDO24_14900 [Pseudomonadota bacterium]
MGTGNLITLTGAAAFTANAGGAVALGPITIGTGSIGVTAGGAVTQTGILTSTSGGGVTINAPGQAIILTNRATP